MNSKSIVFLKYIPFQLIFLFIVSNLYSQKKNFKGIVLFEYGMPCFECNQLRDSIAEKWFVKYEHIALCVGQRNWRDSIEDLNSKSLAMWQKHFKKDWNKFLRTQIDSIEQERKRIEVLETQKKIEKVKLNSSPLTWKLNGRANDSILYRGFANKISFSGFQNRDEKLKFELINATIKIDSTSEVDFYIESKGIERCTLFVYLNNTVFQMIDFKILSTNPPTWNITKSENDINFNFKIISIAVRENELNSLIYPSIDLKSFSLYCLDTIIYRENNVFDDEIWKHILSAQEIDTLKFEFIYENEQLTRRNQVYFTRGKLPTPKVIIDEKTGDLIIRFLENSTLNSYFEVVYWEFTNENILSSGKGRVLDVKTLSTVKKSSNYTFNFQIKCKLTNEVYTVSLVK
jgi:hypothetical protein